jgi:hypothetical protein
MTDQFPPDVVEAVAWAMERAPAGDTPNPNAPDFAIWKIWENEAIAALHAITALGYRRVQAEQETVQATHQTQAAHVAIQCLDMFNRCASQLVSPDYAEGYREACEHVRDFEGTTPSLTAWTQTVRENRMIAHDIVERLRTENSVQLSLGRDLSDLLLDAALEIERLRKLIEAHQ